MPVNADFSKLPYWDANQSKLYTYPLELAISHQLARFVFMYCTGWCHALLFHFLMNGQVLVGLNRA